MNTQIQTTLDQCGFNKPGGESHGCFHHTTFLTNTLEEALERLKDDYDIVPSKHPRGVFVDTVDSKETRQVGFIHTRWGRTDNYDSNKMRYRKYWEENWISFDSIQIGRVTLPKHLIARV